MEFVSIIVIAFSLSMDAFSLALAYGTLGLTNSFSLKIASFVGIFHFLMPLLGMSVKYYLMEYSTMSFDFITSIIYFYLGINFLLESKKEKEVSKICSMKDILMFSLAVSLDSFSVGLAQKNLIIVAPIYFALFSFLFTLIGLKLGKKLSSLFGKTAVIIGGIFFLILGFLHL